MYTFTLCKIDCNKKVKNSRSWVISNDEKTSIIFEFRGIKENNQLRIYSTIAIISSPKNYHHHWTAPSHQGTGIVGETKKSKLTNAFRTTNCTKFYERYRQWTEIGNTLNRIVREEATLKQRQQLFFPVVMYDVRVGLWRKLSAEELMLLNCGVGEDSWESLGLQGDPTSPSWRRSALGVLWKDWR